MKDFFDRYEAHLRSLWLLIFLFIGLYIWSKPSKFSCDDYANSIRDNMEFNMIYKNSGRFSNPPIFGVDTNNREVIYDDGSKWLSHVIDTLKKDDTIIKRKGEYCITVRRKNKVFSIPVICDRVYTDTFKSAER